RLFWKSQTPSEQAHIASAFAFELSKVQLEQVPPRMVGNLLNVDTALGNRVAAGLGIVLPNKNPPAREPVDLTPSPALSIHRNMKNTIEGRQIGILIAAGSDAKAISDLVKSLTKAGATPFIVAPKVGETKLSDGNTIRADGQLLGSPSQLFDAVAVILSKEGAAMLAKEGAAVQWVMDAFGHLKAIGHDATARPLLDRAGIVPDAGVVDLSAFIGAASKRFWDREPHIRMLA
ncbi:catalase-related domain-containing protein, partial [Rhizobium rhizogenes]|uniref:catalase-related domain-containing protein n=1 Tax=Rhizobium rhizogenes TaxID=359 RepID=UPI002356622F